MVADVLAIDPGTTAMGWALMDQDTIIGAGIIRANGLGDMIDAVEGNLLGGFARSLVVEIPQFYNATSKGDPNKLAKLTLLAGVVIGSVEYQELAMPVPNQWKGQVPKKIHNKRVKSKLAPRELATFEYAPASLENNMVDAAGLALWMVDRN